MPRLRDAIFIVFCTGLIVFIGVTERPLERSSEGRVARVAQEMLEDGDWIVPHLNGGARLEKPPLSSWLVALTSQFSGAERVEPWHAFVPPGAATIALVLLIFFWLSSPGVAGAAPDLPNAPTKPSHSSFPPLSQLDKERWLGMLAALFLTAAPGFINQARSAEIDTLLALWVAIAFWGFWKYYTSGGSGPLLAAYAALGLSVLTKGHVGLVVAVPPVVAWRWLAARDAARGNASSAPAAPPGAEARHVIGVAIALLIVLPWAIPFLRNSGMTWETFNREGGTARFSQATGHKEPFYWYWHQMPGWFLPWFLLLPLALWQTHGLPADGRSPLRRLCWLWLGWNMLLFSALTSKQRHYAVPFFPPLAILIADATARWVEHPDGARRRAARLTLAGLSLLLALGAFCSPLLIARHKLAGQLNPGAMWPVAIIAGIVFLMAAAAMRNRGQGLADLWAAAVCLVVIFALTIERAEALQDSPIPFCQQVRVRVPDSARLYDYGVVLSGRVYRAQTLFYLRRKVEHSTLALDKLLKQPDSAFYILAAGKALEGVPREHYEVLAEQKDFMGHGNDVLLIRPRGE